MERKLIWLGMIVGSVAGGYVPTLWGGSMFSLSGVLWTAIGGFVGIWAGYRLGQ